MNFDRRQFLAYSSVLWCGGCIKLPMREQDNFGLTKVALKISSADLSKLRTSQEAKIPFPVSIDLGGLQLQGTIKNTGRSTLDAYKKSFEVNFVEGAHFRGWKSLRLSAQATDPSCLKSLIGFDVFSKFGLLTPSIEPVALYLNHEYAGLYFLIEPIDQDFFGRHRINLTGISKAKFGNADFSSQSLTNFDESYDVEFGSKSATKLRRLIEVTNDPEAKTSQIAELLDIDNYLRYHAVATVLNHFDGYANNFFVIERADQPMLFVPWDLDRIFETDKPDLHYKSGVSMWGANKLSAKIFQDMSLKQKYVTMLRQLLQDIASPQTLKNSAQSQVERIKTAYASDRVLVSQSDLNQQVLKLQANIDTWLTPLMADLAALP